MRGNSWILVGTLSVLLLSSASSAWGQFGGSAGQTPDDPFGPFDSDETARAAEPDAAGQSEHGAQRRRGRPDATLLADQPIAGTEQPPCHCADESNSPSAARIKKVLRGPLTSRGLNLPGTPLEQVVSFLQEEYEIPIQLDTTALNDIGIGPDEPVTVNIRNISLKSALQLILEQLDITYVIRNEVLMITSHEEVESELRVCVYNVRDLVAMPNGRQDFDSLIDTIVNCVATRTWAENGGGVAEIRALPTGLLTISQTQSVHDEIAGLLTAIRNSLGVQPADAAAAVPFEPTTELVTRSYKLALEKDADVPSAGSQVVAMIREIIPGADSRVVDGEKCWIDHLADRIVVRHTDEVHRGISELLRDLGLAERVRFGGGLGSGGIATEGGGGGGFFRPARQVD